MTDLLPLERLRLIIKAFNFCEQEPTLEAVGQQYKHETGEEMDPAVYERALR